LIGSTSTIHAALALTPSERWAAVPRLPGTSGWRVRIFVAKRSARTIWIAKGDRSGKERPLRPREERLETILAQRVRTRYFDRDKEYSLRDSEIHLLSEVGKFRVVAVNDLAELGYNSDRARVENDIENLSRQGLVKRTGIADPEHNLTPVVTLSKEGHKLLSRGKVVSSSQAIYHGQKTQRGLSRRRLVPAVSQGCR
jgi:hypothetical protein